MYGERKSKAAKVALIVSCILHVCAFFVFAMVKLYTEQEVEGAKVVVDFVDQEQIRVLKRSLEVRPVASLEQPKISQRLEVGQRVETKVSYRSSSDFYVDDAPKVFSQIRSINQKAMQTGSIQRPSANLQKSLVREVSVDLKVPNSRSSQLQLGVTGGAQMFGGSSMALAKPEVRAATDTTNILQEFLSDVRRRIESNKTYPPTAIDAGIEGSSGVRMTITKDGQLEKVEIVDSSGYEILDKAALQSVRSAAPFPPIPKNIGREKIEMNLYLVFRIT